MAPIQVASDPVSLQQQKQQQQQQQQHADRRGVIRRQPHGSAAENGKHRPSKRAATEDRRAPPGDAEQPKAATKERGAPLGDVEQALAGLDMALRLEPRNAMALQLRGELHSRLGRYTEAVTDFDATLAVEPHSTAALSGRGSARRALGRHEAAVADFDAALVLEAATAQLLASRGATKLELGWYREAANDFAAALKLQPGFSLAKWGFSMAGRQEQEAPLRRVSLVGFARGGLNAGYLERRQAEFSVSGGPTYWSNDGHFFLFWCRKESRWKASRASDLEKVKAGSSASYAAAPLGANLLSPSLLRGWREWDGAAWRPRSLAGVASIEPVTVPMRSVVLGGFARATLNTEYVERRQLQYVVNSRETYWSRDGQLLLYWCKKDTRWKGISATHFKRIQAGKPAGYVGAPQRANLTSPGFIKGWHEWCGKEWAFRDRAGVVALGRESARLRTVTLAGFKRAAVNARYTECPRETLAVNGREIYIAKDRMNFLYWCNSESRWKVCAISHFQRVREGAGAGYLGAPLYADIFSIAPLKGWHEWFNKVWQFRLSAGVIAMGTLAPEEACNNSDFETALAAGDTRSVLNTAPVATLPIAAEWEAVEELEESGNVQLPGPGSPSGSDTEDEDSPVVVPVGPKPSEGKKDSNVVMDTEDADTETEDLEEPLAPNACLELIAAAFGAIDATASDSAQLSRPAMPPEGESTVDGLLLSEPAG